MLGGIQMNENERNNFNEQGVSYSENNESIEDIESIAEKENTESIDNTNENSYYDSNEINFIMKNDEITKKEKKHGRKRSFAGFATFLVNTPSLDPCPPANIIDIISFLSITSFSILNYR